MEAGRAKSHFKGNVMAKDEGAADSPPPKNKKKLIIIVLVVLLLLGVAGAAALMLLGGKNKKHQREAHAEEPPVKPVVVVLEEVFTANLLSQDDSSPIIQIKKIELEILDPEVAKHAEESKSKISDRINTVLRSKTKQDVKGLGQDQKLKEDLRKAVNASLELKAEDADKKGVKEVLFPMGMIVDDGR